MVWSVSIKLHSAASCREHVAWIRTHARRHCASHIVCGFAGNDRVQLHSRQNREKRRADSNWRRIQVPLARPQTAQQDLLGRYFQLRVYVLRYDVLQLFERLLSDKIWIWSNWGREDQQQLFCCVSYFGSTICLHLWPHQYASYFSIVLTMLLKLCSVLFIEIPLSTSENKSYWTSCWYCWCRSRWVYTLLWYF